MACSGDLHVCVREKLLLLEPHLDGETGDVPIVDAAVAAATAASADAPEASIDICICCSDLPTIT